MNKLEKEKQRVKKLGKQEFIKELLNNAKEEVKTYSTLDLLRDHLTLEDKYQDLKYANKLRKLGKKKAQKLYIKKMKKELKSMSLQELIKYYI